MIACHLRLKEESSMDQDIAGKVKAIIADKLGISESKVVENARFIDDLGADSLDTVELVMALEEEFNIEISNAEGQEIQSVKDAVLFIQSKCK
jgi:acyl carrier protein